MARFLTLHTKSSVYRWRGFTIIELVMVLMILGVLSVSVIPRFFDLIDYQKWVYYNQVLSSMQYARKLAIATGGHIQVSLTPTSVILQRRVEGATCTTGTVLQNIIDPVSHTNGYIKIAPDPVNLNYSTHWPVYFDGLGQVIRTSDCTLIGTETVTIVGGKTITVIGATGFIQ